MTASLLFCFYIYTIKIIIRRNSNTVNFGSFSWVYVNFLVKYPPLAEHLLRFSELFVVFRVQFPSVHCCNYFL